MTNPWHIPSPFLASHHSSSLYLQPPSNYSSAFHRQDFLPSIYTAQLAVFYSQKTGSLLIYLILIQTNDYIPEDLLQSSSQMEPRRTPPEYFLEIFADSTTVRDVLKGIPPVSKSFCGILLTKNTKKES